MGLHDFVKYSISTVLKSFLQIMCIDAPESTTNSRSSSFNIDVGTFNLNTNSVKNNGEQVGAVFPELFFDWELWMILLSAEAILASSTSKFGIEIPRTEDEDLKIVPCASTLRGPTFRAHG